MSTESLQSENETYETPMTAPPASPRPAATEPLPSVSSPPAPALPPALPRAQTQDDATLASLALSSSSTDLLDLDSPSFLLVASLRSQITDLTSQVTGLNSKLVGAYNRNGDLEDVVHEREEEIARLRERERGLVEEKKGWEREIERGGWVERVRFCFRCFFLGERGGA